MEVKCKMSKKRRTVKVNAAKTKKTYDNIIFMVAYDVDKIKRGFTHFWKSNNICKLLKSNHISEMVTKNYIVTSSYACKYSVSYNQTGAVTAITFDYGNSKEPQTYSSEIDDIIFSILLTNSAETLLDTSIVDIDCCFNMESFLVEVGSEIFQINPIVFCMNNIIVVNYNMVNYQTGIALNYNEVCGYSNNYSLKIVDGVKYFDESEFKHDMRKISDIIFSNVINFFENIAKQKYRLKDYIFVHNMIVLSNDIANPRDCFQKIIGAQISELNVRDIGTTPQFNYYTNECLGLVTNYSKDDLWNIARDIQILEAFKMVLLLEMIVDFEVNNSLTDIIDHQINTGILFYPGKVPIITLNLINTVKETVSFVRYKEAIDFKIKALEILQNRQKNSNGKLLNLLLYALALISSIQTLSVLEEKLNISFVIGLIIICMIFVISGIVWYIRENKN